MRYYDRAGSPRARHMRRKLFERALRPDTPTLGAEAGLWRLRNSPRWKARERRSAKREQRIRHLNRRIKHLRHVQRAPFPGEAKLSSAGFGPSLITPKKLKTRKRTKYSDSRITVPANWGYGKAKESEPRRS